MELQLELAQMFRYVLGGRVATSLLPYLKTCFVFSSFPALVIGNMGRKLPILPGKKNVLFLEPRMTLSTANVCHGSEDPSLTPSGPRSKPRPGRPKVDFASPAGSDAGDGDGEPDTVLDIPQAVPLHTRAKVWGWRWVDAVVVEPKWIKLALKH